MANAREQTKGDAVRRLAKSSQLLAAATVVLALTVLLCWAVALEWAVHILPNMTTMRPNTAVCLLLLAICWFIPRQVGAACAGLVLVVTAATLIEYALGVPSGLGDVAFAIPDSTPQPGRMATTTAIGLFSVALSRLIATSRTGRWLGSYRAIETLSLLVMTISTLTLLGYAYGVRSLYSIGPFATMPVITAMALCALGVASFISVPNGSATWIFARDDAGAILLRRLLPVVLFVVPVWGYLRMAGQRAGLYDTSFGLAIMATGSTAIVTGTTWFAARALTTADRGREGAITALRLVNTDLQAQARARAAELEAEHNAAVLLRDRERIAADLHDVVIQRLFAVALRLEMASIREGRPEFSSAVQGIDYAIRDLRGAIYALKESAEPSGLRDTLQGIVRDAALALDIEPDLVIQGEMHSVPADIATELVIVAREAVSNALRHARASALSVELVVTDDEVSLYVRDNGCGIACGQTSASGLSNIRARAERLGGRCAWLSNDPHGTVVSWTVPRHQPSIQAQAEQDPHNQTAHDQIIAAMLDIASGLMADDTDPLPRIAHAIRQMVDADTFSVVVPHDTNTLLILATDGYPKEYDPAGKTVTTEVSLTNHVIDSGQPLRIDDLWDMKASLHQLGRLPYGPVLLVPLVGTSCIWGSVNVTRLRGRAPFSHADVQAAMAIAVYGITALELREHRCPAGIRTLSSLRSILTNPILSS